MRRAQRALEYRKPQLTARRRGRFDVVVCLRTDNTVLYDRLQARGYAQNKITENVTCEIMQVILPTAPAVSNEGGSSELLAPVPAVSWPRVPACGLLEPPRRDGENAQKTRKNGEKMGEIRPKTCEQGRDRRDQLAV